MTSEQFGLIPQWQEECVIREQGWEGTKVGEDTSKEQQMRPGRKG